MSALARARRLRRAWVIVGFGILGNMTSAGSLFWVIAVSSPRSPVTSPSSAPPS